jgi:hypothetical protein
MPWSDIDVVISQPGNMAIGAEEILSQISIAFQVKESDYL